METKLIYSCLCEINKKIEAIGKNQKNQQQGFSFRGIDDVMNELHNLFSENGVIIMPKVLDVKRSERTNKNGTAIFTTLLTVEFTFIASDGSTISAVCLGEAMDSGDKGVNKAMSIALKYALLQMFLIPTVEQKDPDSESHEILSELKQAIDFMSKSLNIGEVKANWESYPQLHSNKDFINTTNIMKKKFA